MEITFTPTGDVPTTLRTDELASLVGPSCATATTATSPAAPAAPAAMHVQRADADSARPRVEGIGAEGAIAPAVKGAVLFANGGDVRLPGLPAWSPPV